MAKVETFFGYVTTVDELPSLLTGVEEGAVERPVLEDVLAEARA
jgi:hypothetical protein